MIRMTLEFETGLIPESVYRDLDFQKFLDQFDPEIPLIPHIILRPLRQSEAENHFRKLANLDKQLTLQQVDLSALVHQSGKLPAIDHLLPFYESLQLEPYHLFELGGFVQESLELEKLEKSVPLLGKSESCQAIRKTLLKFVSDDFGSLKLTVAEAELERSINRLNEEMGEALTRYEQLIYDETGLKLVYPFPKEIDKHHEHLQRVKDCTLLTLVEKDNVYLLEFVLTEAIEDLQQKKENLHQTWQQQIRKKLVALNRALQPYLQSFLTDYRQRKKRCFEYLLLHIKQKHDLCLPLLTTEMGITMQNGVLPLVKKQEPDRYQPLNIALGKGVNVLFGANMTGKTTVLKTLYFHLVLVKFGLPVPATVLTLGFPDRIGLQLRSSGQTGSGLSGFGEELRFFCGIDDSSSVYLIDELFHSTDPVNGVKLSKAFLMGLSASRSLFLCTSHYPDVLTIPGLTFFRMKDSELELNQSDIDHLLEQVPFEVETLPVGAVADNWTDSKKPLRIALHFPLSETIKQNIRKQLET
jgi:DNA mismatch repair ATPase MutS